MTLDEFERRLQEIGAHTINGTYVSVAHEWVCVGERGGMRGCSHMNILLQNDFRVDYQKTLIYRTTT